MYFIGNFNQISFFLSSSSYFFFYQQIQDYLDLSLSERAIPICIRLLQQGSKELSREISSYLNLIACRDPKLLTHYVHYIVDTILKGNSNLCRLLYQICETDVECIYPLTKHLVKALKIIENTNDAVYILQIMYLISLNHVQVIISFDRYLSIFSFFSHLISSLLFIWMI